MESSVLASSFISLEKIKAAIKINKKTATNALLSEVNVNIKDTSNYSHGIPLITLIIALYIVIFLVALD